jgi:glycogen operon protein
MYVKKVFLFLLSVFFYSLLLNVDHSLSEITISSVDNSTETRYGAHIDGEGWVHFVVYSPDAAEVNLLLFDKADDKTPDHTFAMKKSGDDWKIKIKGEGAGAGLFYMYQAKGPNEVFFQDENKQDQYGLMFNENYYLNDPYAYKTQNVKYSAFFTSEPFIDISTSVYAGGGKSIVYDHSNDISPGHVNIKREDLIVYELHVQDYTARIPGLDPSKRGTYLGLARSGLKTPGGLRAGIDHLVELGVNAVEIMPVMEYDEETGNVEGRYNHWGYMTTNFFAPEARYAALEGDQTIELKQLVKAFHEKGITVFIDVVYNHTGEQSPWVSDGRIAAKYYNFLGLNNTHVFRSTSDGRYYYNSTGTGNDISFAGADKYTKRLVNDSLSMWHSAYGVDGFRFDLARILAEGSDNAADWVDNDPRFASAHIHAEPWDLGGQWWDFMDNFGWSVTNNRWAKWLGRYRDKVRKFSASDLKSKTSFKQLIEGYGSVSDVVGAVASTKPWRSINIAAIHDGYTLRDCVFFNDSDGSHNCWDSGGDENLRKERQKLIIGVLLTSQGVPVILQGDEFGRTQSSALSQADAHNSYNYESSTGDININNVNWIDWRLKDGDNSESPNGPTYGKELFHWTKDLVRLRKKWTQLRKADFAEYVNEAWDGGSNSGSANDGRFSYSWEGPNDGEPTELAVIWWGKAGEPDLMVIYNENWDDFNVSNLGDWSNGDWKILARSWFGDDSDFCNVDNWEASCEDAGSALNVKGRSMAILISDND